MKPLTRWHPLKKPNRSYCFPVLFPEKGPLERDFAVEAANQVPATEAVSNPVTAQDKPPEKGAGELHI